LVKYLLLIYLFNSLDHYKFPNFYLVYENIYDYRQDKPEYIVRIFQNNKFKYKDIEDIANAVKNIETDLNIYDSLDIILACVSNSASIVFLKYKEIIMNNII
jgi:hypothetical protein